MAVATRVSRAIAVLGKFVYIYIYIHSNHVYLVFKESRNQESRKRTNNIFKVY